MGLDLFNRHGGNRLISNGIKVDDDLLFQGGVEKGPLVEYTYLTWDGYHLEGGRKISEPTREFKSFFISRMNKETGFEIRIVHTRKLKD